MHARAARRQSFCTVGCPRIICQGSVGSHLYYVVHGGRRRCVYRLRCTKLAPVYRMNMPAMMGVRRTGLDAGARPWSPVAKTRCLFCTQAVFLGRRTRRGGASLRPLRQQPPARASFVRLCGWPGTRRRRTCARSDDRGLHLFFA